MTSIAYGIVIMFTKLAVLFLYRRVLLTHRGRTFYRKFRVFGSILLLLYFSTKIVKIWQCSPRRKIWNRTSPGHCVNIPALFNTSGAFNTITDIMILLVPIVLVWNLRMSLKAKLGIILIFTLGLMLVHAFQSLWKTRKLTWISAPCFSIIGFVVRIRVSANPDVTYNIPTISLWA